MKAKLSIGEMNVEVQGSPAEIAEIIGLQGGKVQLKPDIPLRPRIKKTKGTRKKVTRRGKAKSASPPKKRKRQPIVRWKPEEKEKLKVGCKAKKSIPELAKMLGRSVSAVTQRIIIMRNNRELDED